MLAAAVDRALDRLVFDAGRPGFDWLMALLDDVALCGGTRFAEDFLFFRKSWFSLFGVLGDLSEQPSPDSRMLQLGMQRFLAELPARLLAAPDARDFSTHVSNAALLQLCASPWLAALRYWSRRGSM